MEKDIYKLEPGAAYLIRVTPGTKPEAIFDLSHQLARLGVDPAIVVADAGELEFIPNAEKWQKLVTEHVQAILAEVAGCEDSEMRAKIVEIRERY